MNVVLDPIHRAQETVQAMDAGTPIASPAFYENLFAADPCLRTAFWGDPEEQGRKLVTMLFQAIERLDTPGTLIRVLEAIGRRQRGGAARSYVLAGEALMTSLRDELGDRFTPAVERSWLNVCLLTADVMRHAAGDEAESPVRAPALAA